MKPKTTLFYKQEFEPCCPYCMTTLNGIGSDHGHMPSSGDFSVCLHCGEVLIFHVIAGEIGLRKPKPREAKDALKEPLILQAVLNVKAARGEGGRA